MKNAISTPGYHTQGVTTTVNGYKTFGW